MDADLVSLRTVMPESSHLGMAGLNWINVGADAYAIEQQRLRQLVDNCPSLLRKRKHGPTHKNVIQI